MYSQHDNKKNVITVHFNSKIYNIYKKQKYTILNQYFKNTTGNNKNTDLTGDAWVLLKTKFNKENPNKFGIYVWIQKSLKSHEVDQ